jgi:general secretion pathway protein L
MMGWGLHIAEKAWRWWLSEVVTLLPQAYLKRLGSSRLTILLKPGEAITEIAVMAGEKRVFRERVSYPDAPVEALSRLRDVVNAATKGRRVNVIGVISNHQSLTRPLVLPLAAKAHLGETVRYQIDRLSPFKADNTLYGIKQPKSDGQANELRLELTIVSKALVDEFRERSAKFGFQIDHFATETSDGGALETLAFAGERASRGKTALEMKVLAAVACILAVSLVLVPIVGKWEQATALEKDVRTLKPKAEQVLKMQGERDRIVARRAQMVGLKKASLPPIAVLSRLSEILDDQTFLFDMRMDRGTVTIAGMSFDASKLAQRLGTIEAFKSVKFSGPVTRDVQSARDRFTLILEMAASS